MKINLKNLGVIKTAQIDLNKSLNIFCGPNGTGKTYMAYILYAVLGEPLLLPSMYQMEVWRNLLESQTIHFDIDFKQLEEYRQELLNRCYQQLDELFGISQAQAKQFFNELNLSFDDHEASFEARVQAMSFEKVLENSGKIAVRVHKSANSRSLVLSLEQQAFVSRDEPYMAALFLVPSLLHQLVIHPILGNVFMFPVERNSIFTFSKELSIRKQEAIDHFHAMTSKEKIDKFELLMKSTTRYPKPIRDGLRIAEDLSEIKKQQSPFYDFASALETELLNGKVDINNDGEIQFKSNKASQKALPIHMTASIVKSLSSLVVYLKHLARPADFIIIDEPEINLHPSSQIILTRIFARLLSQGFRLLISTHSDYIIREINNMIMLSNPHPKIQNLRQQHGYEDSEIIRAEQVGVLYFNFQSSKKNYKHLDVKALAITKTGFEVPSIDETIVEQNEINANLTEIFYEEGMYE